MAHGIPIGDAGEEVARERPPRMWSLYLHIFRVGRPRGQRLFVLSHVYAYTSCHSYRELNFGPRVDRDDKRGLLFMGERNLYALIINVKNTLGRWAQIERSSGAIGAPPGSGPL